MVKKLFMTMFFILCATAFISCSYDRCLAFGDDEVKKIKADPALMEEFYKLMQECFTDVKFEGVTKQMINGAYVESKYVAYSRNLDYKRIDINTYGDKISIVTTPEKAWFYLENYNMVIYFTSVKNLAKHNFNVYYARVKDDGKITKNVSDGQITYKLVDYTYNTKQTFVFDEASKKMLSQIVETEGGEKTESTYKSWENKKSGKDIFEFPSRATQKCGD